ncbi:hypothetical protein V6N13_054599 [Hibiscus sabdariffa]
MVAETWILKMGNQVSANLKHALLPKETTPKKHQTVVFRSCQCDVQNNPSPQIPVGIRDPKLPRHFQFDFQFVNSTANLYHELETFDNVVELLARSVCTIFARILVVFGESALRKDSEFGRLNGDREEVVSRPSRWGLSKISSVGSGQFGNVREKRGLSMMHWGNYSRKGDFGPRISVFLLGLVLGEF